jgi:hypothetical protein
VQPAVQGLAVPINSLVELKGRPAFQDLAVEIDEIPAHQRVIGQHAPGQGLTALAFASAGNGNEGVGDFSADFVEQDAVDLGAPSNDLINADYMGALFLGYRYDRSSLIAPDGTPAPPDVSLPYTQTARPGARAPHVWLSDGRSTLDLYGRGFTLLRLGPNPPAATRIAEAAACRGVPLSVVALAEPNVLAAYERRLVLVRPDGHVAWRADREPEDASALFDTVRGERISVKQQQEPVS